MRNQRTIATILAGGNAQGTTRAQRRRIRHEARMVPQWSPGQIGTTLDCPPGERPVRHPEPPFNWVCKPFGVKPCPPTVIPDQAKHWDWYEPLQRAYQAGCRAFRRECGIPIGWIPSSTPVVPAEPGTKGPLVACPPTCTIGIDDELAGDCPPGQVVDLTDPEMPCVTPCPPGMRMTTLKPWGVPDPHFRDICCPVDEPPNERCPPSHRWEDTPDGWVCMPEAKARAKSIRG